MKIAAIRGETAFLLVADDLDLEDIPGDAQGRVLDRSGGVLYPPWGVHSILARGYWEPYDGPRTADELLDDDIERMEVF